MQGMTPLTPVIMIAWIPLVLMIFARLSPTRAVVASFLVAWLFLPLAQFHIQGIPAYSKMSATTCGVLLAATIFDPKRMGSLAFFPSLVDLPMLVWCFCPIATAISNAPDLTLHDGLSWTLENIVSWGLPYLIGRIYFNNAQSLRELIIGIFIGGLLYIPLCLYEARMSPQLHRIVYGWNQHSVAQQLRGSTYRPMVFMEHGLALALFMTSAALAGLWLWYTGSIKRIGSVPMLLLLVPLWCTTLLCRSTGASILLLLGTMCLFLSKWIRTNILLLALMLIQPGYILARTAMNWNPEDLHNAAMAVAGPARAQSLDFRFYNEKLITAKALERPWFGWGGYARSFPLDAWGQCRWTPDSLWIILLGTYGAVGLGAVIALSLPIVVLLIKANPRMWGQPEFTGVAVFIVLLLLYGIDNLVNAMPNPIFLLGLGGLSSLANGPVKVASQRAFAFPVLQT